MILDLLALFVYPILFMLFCLMAIFALVDNSNRLLARERMLFHLLLALIFMVLGMINPVAPVVGLETGRRIVRILALLLIVVMTPPVARHTRALIDSYRQRE